MAPSTPAGSEQRLDVGVRGSRAVPAGLIIWISVACACNVLWIHPNAAPLRSWDDAECLADSVRIDWHVATVSRLERSAYDGRMQLFPRRRDLRPARR
jgi:hypothetical protein